MKYERKMTGVPWRTLPPDYGDWKNTHRWFCRRQDKGIWEKLPEDLSPEPELKWLMLDASHMKVYPHPTGGKGGKQEIGLTKGGQHQTAACCGVDASGKPDLWQKPWQIVLRRLYCWRGRRQKCCWWTEAAIPIRFWNRAMTAVLLSKGNGTVQRK